MNRLSRRILENEYHEILAAYEGSLAEHHRERNPFAYDPLEAGRREGETWPANIRRGLRENFLAMYGPFVQVVKRLDNAITATIEGFFHHSRAQRDAEARAALETARARLGRHPGQVSVEDQTAIVELYARARLLFGLPPSALNGG